MSESESSPSGRQDPTSMALRGRIGALRLHATHDPRETTRKARETFLAKFLLEVDPDGVLPAEERVRRAGYARRAYFAQLAFRRHQSRRTSGRPTQKKAAEGKSAAGEEAGGADPNTSPE